MFSVANSWYKYSHIYWVTLVYILYRFEKYIIHNLITWLIIVEMVSYISSVYRTKSKVYTKVEKYHSLKKKRSLISNIDFWVFFRLLKFEIIWMTSGQMSRLRNYVSCLNFWDEACWFLSLRVFGLLSSSLLLFPQRFGRYVPRPSSGVCRLNFWDEA